MIPQFFRVRSKRQELSDVVTITIETMDGEPCPEFQPGQFFMLYAFGIGEVPISISGSAQERSHITFTIRSVGAVSKALTELNEGDQVGVRGPFGTGWPLDVLRDRDVMIIAGGIGMAPLRPVVYEILRHRSQFRNAVLLYGSRSPENCLYDTESTEWKLAESIEVLKTVDVAPTGYRGRVGLVTRLIAPSIGGLVDPVVLMCGPEIMMRFALSEVISREVEKEDTYLSFERNMKCALGVCGRCQFGPSFVCKNGPVLSYANVEDVFHVREC